MSIKGRDHVAETWICGSRIWFALVLFLILNMDFYSFFYTSESFCKKYESYWLQNLKKKYECKPNPGTTNPSFSDAVASLNRHEILCRFGEL